MLFNLLEILFYQNENETFPKFLFDLFHYTRQINHNSYIYQKAALSLKLCTEDPWVTTTRIVGPNAGKNNTSSSRRNKDKDERKGKKKNFQKERERDRDRDIYRDRDRDRDIYRDRDRDRDNYRDRDRDRDRDNYRERDRDRDRDQYQYQYPQPETSHYDDFDYSYNPQRNFTNKHSKSFVFNRTYVWPSHTNKQINNYYSDRREPKYYLGNLSTKFK